MNKKSKLNGMNFWNISNIVGASNTRVTNPLMGTFFGTFDESLYFPGET